MREGLGLNVISMMAIYLLHNINEENKIRDITQDN